MSVLLTSGGSLVGQNVLNCLDGRRSALRLVATTSVFSEPALASFDAVYPCPETSQTNAFLAAVHRILERENPALVIPCRDEDLSVLAGPGGSDNLLGGSATLANILFDKLLSAGFCKAAGLPFAASIGLAEPLDRVRAFAKAVGWPVILKPVRGFASKGVTLITDGRQLQRCAGSGGGLLQEYIGNTDAALQMMTRIREAGFPLFQSFEEQKISIQLFIERDGQFGAPFVSANTMVHGKSEMVQRLHDDELDQLGMRCGRAFAKAGWQGPLNVQCGMHPERGPVIYEMNGRFTGATYARLLLGCDELRQALARFAGIDVGQWHGPQSPTLVQRSLGMAGCPIDLSAALGAGRVWERGHGKDHGM